MKDEIAKVSDTFASLEPPASLNERTLQNIEAYAAEHDLKFADDEPSLPAKGSKPKAQLGERMRPKGKVIRFFALAACFAFAFVGVFGAKAYAEPTAYIDMDVNPSITLGVNRFDRVVSAEGLNEDGRALLEQVQVTGMTSTEAMDALLGSDVLSGYLDDESVIEVRVAGKSESQSRKLEERIGSCLAENTRSGSCSTSSMEDRKAAHDKGMGVGRYEMAKELVEADPAYDFEDCATMSMRELRQHAAEAKGEDQIQDGQGSGYHHGEGSQGSGNGQGAGNGSGHGQGNDGHGKGKTAND